MSAHDHDKTDATAGEMPEFRDWARDPDNGPALDLLAADFLADEGVELIADLIDCRGQQHQWTAERWVERLGKRFQRWWAEGQPQLRAGRRVRVTYRLISMEYEARRMLDASLPPGAVASLTRHWRKLPLGESELAGWTCKVEDGGASGLGNGATPGVAVAKALAAWREFVTASRFEMESPVADDSGERDRPPLLDAPSADPADASNEGRDKRAV